MNTAKKIAFAGLVLAMAAGAFAQSVKNAAATPGTAQTAGDKQRMIAAVAEVMPVGKIMQDVAASDPYWPSSKARNPNPAKLSCMRANLKEDAYRKVLLTRVDAYARDNGDRFGRDLVLMESEGAKLFSKIMMAGARNATQGETTEMSALMKDASPRGMLDLMRLANDADNAPLRALMGMESAIGTNEKNGKEIGENAGMTMMLPMLVNAMETCKVNMDEL